MYLFIHRYISRLWYIIDTSIQILVGYTHSLLSMLCIRNTALWARTLDSALYKIISSWYLVWKYFYLGMRRRNECIITSMIQWGCQVRKAGRARTRGKSTYKSGGFKRIFIITSFDFGRYSQGHNYWLDYGDVGSLPWTVPRRPPLWSVCRQTATGYCLRLNFHKHLRSLNIPCDGLKRRRDQIETDFWCVWQRSRMQGSKVVQ